MVDGPSAELDRLMGRVRAPLRLAVTGRPGAGCRTVAAAMRAAGVLIVTDQRPEVMLYVLADVPTDEDRDALSGMMRRDQSCVAVLNKADLSGFRGSGPMATARARCRALTRETGAPSAPLAALAARSGCRGLHDVVLVGLRTLALDPARLTAGIRRLLLAELDLYGLAHGVAAVRAGASADHTAAALRRASGVDEVVAAVERAGAVVRYRRFTLASALLLSRSPADDASVAARAELAADVLRTAGVPSPEPGIGTATKADCLRTAVAWQRYARGPVGELHRDCARDLSRAWLRRWAAR